MDTTFMHRLSRRARHARCPERKERCHAPYCDACGTARVEQVQDEVLRKHQPRPQP